MDDVRKEVLVVGAGPTGLLLSLVLARLGIGVRLIDSAPEPGTTSRALALQARTLELYRQLDLADEVVRRGLVLGGVNLWRRGALAGHIDLGKVGSGRSPYPYGLIFPQDEHERFLIERLEAAGVRVERSTSLVGAREESAGVIALLRTSRGEERCSADYVAGCDGAHSRVRESLGIGFPGGTYEHLFYVADVEARGPVMNRELHVVLDEAGFLGIFPLAGVGRVRLVGTIREEAEGAEKTLRWEDIDRGPLDRIGLHVERVNWFSAYRVHHRVADGFRRGRLFLLGDAAHIHSPVGGQGMNTGLGDAMNLGWKLAAVLRQRARADLLDTYEPERIAFARKLVSTTDRVFQAASSRSSMAAAVRLEVVPRVVAAVSHAELGRRFFFRVLSQTGISYRHSSWSEGRVGARRAGDRLPWVPGSEPGASDNFGPLRSLDWQVHVYGTPSPKLRRACDERRLPLHAFAFERGARFARLREDAVYLLRPDGYLGAAWSADQAPEALVRYVDVHGIQVRT